MKSKKLQDAVGMIDEDLVARADQTQKTKKKAKIFLLAKWTAPIAAVLAIVFIAGIFIGNDSPVNPLILKAHAIYEADYPEMADYPNERLPNFDEKYRQWREDQKEKSEFYGAGENLDDFIQKMSAEILCESGGENRVYSPLNVYMALAMLAEITDGNSRKQILNLLGSEDIEALRTQANAIWNANYNDDGATTSILASSLWLNENIAFNDETMQTLAENYYASSYQGEMGSSDLNKALQAWLNEQTGGLLKDYISDIEFSPRTVIALATMICFQTKWNDEFIESKTDTAIFHGANSDQTTDFMHESDYNRYFWGENFTAVSKHLENSGSMWFILPDENVSIDGLLLDEEALSFITSNGEWDNMQYLTVNLSVPKFDVSSKFDLIENLKNLGITDLFEPDISDYTPLLDESAMTLEKDLYLSKAEHGARVAIDEEGVTGVAYTVMVVDGAGTRRDEDEIDFVLDRPFIFVITGSDGLPLFIGIVNQI